YGGGESSRRFENTGYLVFGVGLSVELQFHDLAQFFRLGPINREHQCLLEKWIVDLSQFCIQRNNSFAARLIGITNQTLDHGVRAVLGFSEHVNQAAQSVEYNRQRILNKNGTERSAKNNHRRRRLQDLRKVSALQQKSGNNAAHSDEYTAQRGFIHSQLRQGSGCASVSEAGGAATATDNDGQTPRRIARRNWRMRSNTCSAFSRTTIFSPLTSVITVSGACSTNLIRSELTARGWLFKRVSLIRNPHSRAQPDRGARYALKRASAGQTRPLVITSRGHITEGHSLQNISF